MLQSLAEPDAAAQALASAPPELASFSGSGGGVINVDGPAIASSLIVLLMLLALSANRILGLEQMLG